MDYQLDKVELGKIKKNLKTKIEKNYYSADEINLKLGWKKDTYSPLTPTSGIYFKNKEATHGLQKGRNKGAVYFLFISIVFSFHLNYVWLKENDFIFNIPIIILSISQLMFLILLLTLLKDKKIYFKTTKYYFEINQQKIFYNDIVTLGTATGNERTPRVDLVVGTKSKGLIQLNLDRAAISPLDIAEIVKLNEA